MSYDKVDVPDDGEAITLADEETGELNVPENPIIPIIHGDGIGTDVGPAAQKVLDAAAEATGRSIAWMRVYAGGSARDMYDENLPEDTVSAIRDHRVAIKGPLTTPVGAGFRSLNVALRKTLDLYANVRPTYYLDGVPSPVKNPEKMDMITFRENTEDVYAGIEWEAGTDEVEQVRDFLEDDMEIADVIHDGPVGIGVKPISEFGSKRLIREAIDYALANDRDSVTLVHKGTSSRSSPRARSVTGATRLPRRSTATTSSPKTSSGRPTTASSPRAPSSSRTASRTTCSSSFSPAPTSTPSSRR